MGDPIYRRLQVFTLDPSADVCLDTASIGRTVIKVSWEKLAPGPIGEYLEVIDIDPASNCVYAPVNLEKLSLVATDGEAPSTGNPQFHQQMVYAVAMRTIDNFEQVLGRKILWAERDRDEQGQYINQPERKLVQRLRVYPHALRDENAYYSPAKKALLFGYFNASTTDPREELPGGVVFSCLSHDIVAHEMTHAILDGMHRRLLAPSNADMLAFHEGYADIIAIFQHFTLPGFLPDQIQRTRGDLGRNNLLAKLAVQFARSTGRGDALRNALGAFDRHGNRAPPDPTAFGRTFEPHARGAILVAAIFDAFLRIYQGRVADLRRIATGGTGLLPDGDIHPDLSARFASEAAEAARRILNMCIRALDYLPPVDVTFGDFLRALVTADADFVPDDPGRYRLAIIESFRERGIYPLDVRTLAEDTLRWSQISDQAWAVQNEWLPPIEVLRTMAFAYEVSERPVDAKSTKKAAPLSGRESDTELGELTRQFLTQAWLGADERPRGAAATVSPRRRRADLERQHRIFLHQWLTAKARTLSDQQVTDFSFYLGIDVAGLRENIPTAPLELHAIRPTVRIRPDGRSKVELMIVLTQRRWIKLAEDSPVEQSVRGAGEGAVGETVSTGGDEELGFWFRSGCTLIVNPDEGTVRYSIGKSAYVEHSDPALETGRERLARQRKFVNEQLATHGDEAIARLGLTRTAAWRLELVEPFAVAHGSHEPGGGY